MDISENSYEEHKLKKCIVKTYTENPENKKVQKILLVCKKILEKVTNIEQWHYDSIYIHAFETEETAIKFMQYHKDRLNKERTNISFGIEGFKMFFDKGASCFFDISLKLPPAVFYPTITADENEIGGVLLHELGHAIAFKIIKFDTDHWEEHSRCLASEYPVISDELFMPLHKKLRVHFRKAFYYDLAAQTAAIYMARKGGFDEYIIAYLDNQIDAVFRNTPILKGKLEKIVSAKEKRLQALYVAIDNLLLFLLPYTQFYPESKIIEARIEKCSEYLPSLEVGLGKEVFRKILDIYGQVNCLEYHVKDMAKVLTDCFVYIDQIVK